LDSNTRNNNPINNSPYNINSNSNSNTNLNTFKPQIKEFFDDLPKTPGSPQTVHVLEKDRSNYLAGSLNQMYSIQKISQPNTGNTTNHNTTK